MNTMSLRELADRLTELADEYGATAEHLQVAVPSGPWSSVSVVDVRPRTYSVELVTDPRITT